MSEPEASIPPPISAVSDSSALHLLLAAFLGGGGCVVKAGPFIPPSLRTLPPVIEKLCVYQSADLVCEVNTHLSFLKTMDSLSGICVDAPQA